MSFVLQKVPIGRLRKNPFNPRKTFDPKESDEQLKIRDMAESIKSVGILEPLIGRPRGDNVELAVGERRRMGAEIAGMEAVPVLVKEMDDETMRRYAVVENIHRLDLTGREKEEALGAIWEKDYKGRKKRGQATDVSEMARDFGIPHPTLYKYITAYTNRNRIQLPAGGSELTSQEIADVAGLAEEEPEAAQDLAEARAEGDLTREEFEEAVSIVKATPKHKKKAAAKKVRRAAHAKKKAQTKAKRHVEQALAEVKDEIEEKEDRKTLQILLNKDERLLNRVADFMGMAERLDATYLELFKSPEWRGRAIEVLEKVRNLVDHTLQRAKQNQGRWQKEWKEELEELGVKNA